MRILIASRLFAPEPAVAAVRLAALARRLAGRGHEVEVLTSRLPRDVTGPEVSGIRVRRAPVLRDRLGAVRGYLPYLSFDVPLFFRLLLARRPDVIVVEPPPTTGTAVRWAAKLRRVRYVYYAADLVSDAAEQAGSPALVVAVVRRLERLAVRRAAAVLVVSDAFARRLRDWGVPDERLHLVGNGADTSIFRLEGDAVTREQPYALYAGTANWSHGAAIFVEAVARVEGLRLVYLGSGVEQEAIAADAERLAPGRVDFVPTVPPHEAAAWLRGAAVALASAAPATPGRAAYPFFPAKLHAAAACGTPMLYVGEGAGGAFAQEAPHSRAVPYDPALVAAALSERAHTPASAEQRAELAAWAESRVSLDAVAERAATAIEGLSAPHPAE